LNQLSINKFHESFTGGFSTHLMAISGRQPLSPLSNLALARKEIECHILSELMDAFWLIPSVMVAIVLLAVFYAYIRTRPLSPSTPRVLLDKSSENPPIDPAAEARDWAGRPCGSFLDWLSDRDK
jgi:hypothetical protein